MGCQRRPALFPLSRRLDGVAPKRTLASAPDSVNNCLGSEAACASNLSKPRVTGRCLLRGVVPGDAAKDMNMPIPHGVGARRLFSLVAAAVLALAGVAQAQTSDTTPPALIDLSFSPTSIDTTESAQPLTVSLRLADSPAGVQRACVDFRSPSGQFQGACLLDPDHLIAGDETDGLYQTSLLFPRFAESGTWHLYQVSVVDDAGSLDFLTEGELTAAGFPTTLQVVSQSDTTPPAIQALSFNPQAVDVSEGDATVDVLLQVADAQSGVFRVCLALTSPSMAQLQGNCTTFSENGSTFSFEVPILQFAEAGTWRVTSVELTDNANNYVNLTEEDLIVAELPTELQVSSVPSDVTAPLLLDFAFTPSAVDTSSGDATVTITALVADDISGPASLCVTFASPSGLQEVRRTCLAPSGEGLETTWEGSLVFPQYGESGAWQATLWMTDRVGNFRFLDEVDLVNTGFPTIVTVASGTPEMPSIFRITSGDGRLTVSFFPGFDGGFPITNYEYSVDNGQTWVTRVPAATGSPLVITGLTNGVLYPVRLRAVNANGGGTPSLAVNATPRAPAGVVLDGFDPGADGPVYSLVVQPDGKIVVGGGFTTLGGGGTGQVERSGIGRLNPDGSVDQTFDAGAFAGFYSSVRAMVLQPDGKIVVGGDDIADSRNIVRLNPDGSVDTTFLAAADFAVYALALQPDGRIVVGGTFSNLTSGGVPVPRAGIGRLNSDGSVDLDFNPGLDSDGFVEALALQPDGRIVVGGRFFSVGGSPRDHLARLEADGTVDETFTGGVGLESEGFVFVSSLALQPDGRILVGGDFETVTGIGEPATRHNIARLTPDGSVDATFVPPPEYAFEGAGPTVETIVVLPNGQILVGGWSVAVRVIGEPGQHVQRFNADGSVDTTFDAMVDWLVREAILLPDGRILIGGDFESVAGEPRNGLAILDVGIPGPPAISAITPGDGQLSVAFTAPASAFPVTNYEYSLDGGETWLARSPASTASPIVIQDLTNGVTYIVALRAVTASAAGPASEPLAAIPVATPGAPTISTIAPGDGQLSVFFLPPASDGGGALVNYEFSIDNGATWTPRSPASLASPLVIAGLTNGTTYLVALRAVNVSGPGAPSAPVAGVLSTTPSAPLVTGILSGNGRLTVIFVPGFDGGEAISHVEFSLNGGASWQSGGQASPIVIAGLSNGTVYTLQLRAVNANGAGAASTPVQATPGATLDEAADAFDPGVDGEVRALVVQPDGRILVGGAFTRLGENATWPRNNLGRLNADGSVDTAFDPPNIGPSSLVSAVLLQSDGRIVLAGDGPDPTGDRTYTARLEADGSFDGSFQGAANGPIYALAQQPDGRILIGGSFSAVGLSNEWPRQNLARLNADGTADLSFNPGVNGIVNAIVVQPDGRILIGGAFTAVGGVARSNLARLDADGSVDSGFVGGASALTAAAVEVPGVFVAALSLQSDGKILVGGRFTELGGGQATGFRVNVGRVNADGTLDPTFNAGSGSLESEGSFVETILVLPTRRILIGGVSVNSPHDDGAARHLARLLPDGSLDVDFNPRPDDRVRALALQADGKVIVGGRFSTIGGSVRYRIARLGGSGPTSPETPPVPVPFTDPTLVSGVTPLRAIHLLELRTRVDALRQRFGLGAVGWTDAVLTHVPARAVHIQQLRDALLEAFDLASIQGVVVPRPVFADSPATAGATPIRALHIQQLRDAVVLLEGASP